jgi:hypothetical protein
MAAFNSLTEKTLRSGSKRRLNWEFAEELSKMYLM